MKRILAFTASRDRPILLRHAILQMLMQTYKLDLSVYINSPGDAGQDGKHADLYNDLKQRFEQGGQKLIIGYGPTRHQHLNHLAALKQADLDAYDLFLKIDDDDVYRLTYVSDVVKDFEEKGWDFSGEASHGVIVLNEWRPEKTIANLGVGPGRKDCGLASTWAFSRPAIHAIFALDDNTPMFEDQLWKRHIEDCTNLRLHRRSSERQNYHYHIHTANTVVGPHWPSVQQ